jgi:AmmeMemoRadiSam system protein B
MEHGTEVILPFLQKLNPRVQVVPMTIGTCTYEQTAIIAKGLALASLMEESVHGVAPLLVISSDMNHFASEQVGRELDRTALRTMADGDPQRLYQTCIEKNISMCGMRPAVAVMRALQTTTPVIKPELVYYTTSAATSGDTSRVVGYAGVVIE